MEVWAQGRTAGVLLRKYGRALADTLQSFVVQVSFVASTAKASRPPTVPRPTTTTEKVGAKESPKPPAETTFSSVGFLCSEATHSNQRRTMHEAEHQEFRPPEPLPSLAKN